MQPNLERIPADGDARAEQILAGLAAAVDVAALAGLDQDDVLALGRYGNRQVTVALRTGSTDLSRDAVLAAALAELLDPSDWRDLLVGLAQHHHVARALRRDPARLFADVAGRLPPGEIATLLREFGARNDVTPQSFGWRIADTPDGPDFVPDR